MEEDAEDKSEESEYYLGDIVNQTASCQHYRAMNKIRVCGLCWQATITGPQDKDHRDANQQLASPPAQLRSLLEQSDDGQLQLKLRRPSGPDLGPINCSVVSSMCEQCQDTEVKLEWTQLKAEAAMEGEASARKLWRRHHRRWQQLKSKNLKLRANLSIKCKALQRKDQRLVMALKEARRSKKTTEELFSIVEEAKEENEKLEKHLHSEEAKLEAEGERTAALHGALAQLACRHLAPVEAEEHAEDDHHTAAEMTVQHLDSRLDELSSTICQQDATIDVLLSAESQLKNQVENARKEADRLDTLKVEKEMLEEELRGARNLMTKVTSERNQYKESWDSAQSQIQSTMVRLSQEEKEKEALKRELRRVEEDKRSARKHAKYKRKWEEAAGKLTQSESEVQSLKADVARLREVARCAEEDRAKLLEACDNMKTLKEDKKSLGNKLQAAERDRDRYMSEFKHYYAEAELEERRRRLAESALERSQAALEQGPPVNDTTETAALRARLEAAEATRRRAREEADQEAARHFRFKTQAEDLIKRQSEALLRARSDRDRNLAERRAAEGAREAAHRSGHQPSAGKRILSPSESLQSHQRHGAAAGELRNI